MFSEIIKTLNENIKHSISWNVLTLSRDNFTVNCLLITRDLDLKNNEIIITLSSEEISEIKKNTPKIIFIKLKNNIYVTENLWNLKIRIRYYSLYEKVWDIIINKYLWKPHFWLLNFLWE